MTDADDLFDRKLLKKITDVLQSCSIHRASVSFRCIATDAYPPKSKRERILTWETQGGETHASLVSSPRDTPFHIASITKMLVATAIVHAIEVKAVEDVADNRWSKFEGISMRSIRDVYNKNRKRSEPEMGIIPGDPTVYEYILHSKGLQSSNDDMLAPDGTPIMGLRDVPAYLTTLSQRGAEHSDGSKRWTCYSNMNFAVIALTIETLWDGRLDNFMDETLFKPLKMDSTSIGFPTSHGTASSRWTVDQHDIRRQVQIPEYEVTGAEAGALGAYSTAQDLDNFFSSVIKACHDHEPTTMIGFSWTVDRLIHMENTYIDGVYHYTPFGLHTKLNESTIGLSSTNGLQFPEELFTRYPVIPGGLGQKYSVHYMAGSAVGCCCTTALRIHETENFALVILTDTSGPVAVADHILRLILRKFVDLQNPYKTLLRPTRDSVKEMVMQAKKSTIENWKKKDEEDQQLRDIAHPQPLEIQGTFNAVGNHQKLHVEKRSDGKTYLAVSGTLTPSGTTTPAMSGYFELLWKDDEHLWLCVPPYMSIDRLDRGDWSNLLFEVIRDASGAIELTRKKMDGTENRYRRQT